jgi:hypothetical protein
MLGKYAENWRRYKKTRNWALALLFSLIPLLLISDWAGGYVPEQIRIFGAILIILACNVQLILLARWPCPRCGKWFSQRSEQWMICSFNSFYNPKCVHCGLPKYADDDVDTNAILTDRDKK